MPQVLFRVIRANSPKWSVLYNELEKSIDTEVKPALVAWFNKVTRNWTHKQVFKATKSITPSQIEIAVYPTGPNAKIWGYVSKGTKGPYPIPKPGNKRAKTLRFREGYKARTTTSGGYNGPGKATGKTVFRKHVTHPGIKARNFERHIARWYRPQFRRAMKNAVARGLRKAKAA